MQEESFQQVDFTVENLGKVFTRSKKRITWTFQQRRGDQHQQQMHKISFLWSKRTGKQSIDITDNQQQQQQQVWFGRKKGASVFSHQWTTQDGLNLHILATRVTPKRNVSQQFRKYDLIINGQVFALLPRISPEGTIILPSSPTATNTTNDDNQGPSSILGVFYPNGYEWGDDSAINKNINETTGQHALSTAVRFDEYQTHVQLRQR